MLCEKCQNRLLDNAKFCNKCGAKVITIEDAVLLAVTHTEPCDPVDEYANAAEPGIDVTDVQQRQNPPLNEALFNKLPETLRSKSIIVAIGVGVIVLVAWLAAFSSSSIKVTAPQIAKEYHQNINEANKKYKDKEIEISGKVIRKGQFVNSGDIFIELETPYVYQGINVLVAFEIDQKSKINNVKKGDFVKVKGECMGNVKQQRSNMLSIQIEGKSME